MDILVIRLADANPPITADIESCYSSADGQEYHDNIRGTVERIFTFTSSDRVTQRTVFQNKKNFCWCGLVVDVKAKSW